MDIRGKKIAFLGDSITYGVGTSSPEKVYWKIIEERTGAICRGHGINGTRIARQVSPNPEASHDSLHFITRVEQIEKDTDIIIVFGGVNDFGHGDAALGKMSDRRDDTFYGACHLLYEKLISSFPTADIFIMTPLHCAGEEKDDYNSIGLRQNTSLAGYVNVIKEVAAYYSLAVIDLYATSGINPAIEAQREIYMPDGLHPSDAGNERIAGRIIAFLNTI